MTGDPRGTDGEGAGDRTPGALPRWVPAVIGVVLIALAALAIFTGLRYRGGSLGRAFDRAASNVLPPEGGVPGEPTPGASRMEHGAGGDRVPQAHRPGERGSSRVVITGGEGGVIPSIRLSAQRAMRVTVEPSDALIWVNDQLIGSADHFATPDLYEFPEEGEYTVRLHAPGFDEIEYIVVVDPAAPNEIAQIETTLRPE
ncbi:MAG TPA: hypothetical protein VMS56_04755 [Thermoanaerobaculia bacterium]|nr:hypothetical protein [Thermoanaerobaculia bacterium]